ncbi:hypothetical protein ACTA71_009335 [Dictyostelium dimigraforme]
MYKNEENRENVLPNHVKIKPSYEYHFSSNAPSNASHDTEQQLQPKRSKILVLQEGTWDEMVTVGNQHQYQHQYQHQHQHQHQHQNQNQHQHQQQIEQKEEKVDKYLKIIKKIKSENEISLLNPMTIGINFKGSYSEYQISQLKFENLKDLLFKLKGSPDCKVIKVNGYVIHGETG